MDLAKFLLARIAEDEFEANKRLQQVAALGMGVDVVSDRICGKSWPGRVLAECDAKRRVLERWYHDEMTLRLLALPYADHPDYRPATA